MTLSPLFTGPGCWCWQIMRWRILEKPGNLGGHLKKIHQWVCFRDADSSNLETKVHTAPKEAKRSDPIGSKKVKGGVLGRENKAKQQ